MSERTNISDLPISNEIKKAVKEMGFEEATYIQSQSIPLILDGFDIIGHSQTGTGKTAAFGIPIIEKITKELSGKTQTLILCPTRELAIQGCEEIRKFAKYKHGISVVPVYGGQHIDRQINSLKKGVEIVIGTPGRIMDHMRRRTLKLDNLSMVVLDEADEMLNMGFREDIETILRDVPEGIQTVLFSATMPPEIMQITHQYQNNPKIVKAAQQALTVPSIQQYYYEVPGGKKIETMSRLLDYYNPNRSIVFCNTKRMVDELVDELKSRGYQPDGLHGDMKQQSRTTVMNAFKNGRVDILIATDVAARGIDVDNVDAVFNYDLPQDLEYYVHRIGRTGRAGKTGVSYTFVSGRGQIRALKEIERHTKSKIELKKIPSMGEVNEVRSDKLIERLSTALSDRNFRKYEFIVEKLMETDYTSVEIASAALYLLNENATDDTQLDSLIAKGEKPEKRPKKEKGKDSKEGMKPFIFNIGNNDKVTAKQIVAAITETTGLPPGIIGPITVNNTHSIVDISKKYADFVSEEMRGACIRGKAITVRTKRPKKKK